MFIVYKTTNKINKKFYIGVHCLEAKKSHKTYFGSGKLIKLALKKYGRENFVVETKPELITLSFYLYQQSMQQRDIQIVNFKNNFNFCVCLYLIELFY